MAVSPCCHCAFILYPQSALCPQNHMPKHTVTEMKITHQQTFKQKPPWAIWPHPMLAFTGADGASEERIGQMAGRWRSGVLADSEGSQKEPLHSRPGSGCCWPTELFKWIRIWSHTVILTYCSANAKARSECVAVYSGAPIKKQVLGLTKTAYYWHEAALCWVTSTTHLCFQELLFPSKLNI